MDFPTFDNQMNPFSIIGVLAVFKSTFDRKSVMETMKVLIYSIWFESTSFANAPLHVILEFQTAAKDAEVQSDFCLHLSVEKLIEPRCEKTGFLHMRKQKRRSASR